jgi:putative ABC transport system permease protein
MEKLFQDIRFGIRMLLKNPGFTLVAASALALGIGAVTAIFSIVDAVLLRPLPYHEPERLVIIWEKPPRTQRNVVSEVSFTEWRKRATLVDKMCAFVHPRPILSGPDGPEQLEGAAVSAAFFELLGVEPMLGRAFLPEEEEPGSSKVALLSYGLWTRRFGADPAMVGSTISLDGETSTVIGIMPPGFRFRSSRTEVWMPLDLDPSPVSVDLNYLRVAARLKDGVTLEQARAEMNAIEAGLAEAYPEERGGWATTIDPLDQYLTGTQLRESLVILFAAVGFLLLIACVNVANLLLARGAARHREIAIRCSLGAGRLRLVRQLLTESVVLVAIAGAIAVAFTSAFVRIFPLLFPAVRLPANAHLQMDGRVLIFTLATASLASFFFGLVPAWRVSRIAPSSFLKEAAGAVTGARSARRFKHALVVVEVALALVLVIGAGLLMRTLTELYQVELGFRPQNVLTMNIDLPSSSYSEASKIVSFYRETLEKVERLPGVKSASIATTFPLQGSRTGMYFDIEGSLLTADPSDRPGANFQIISPDYFDTLGIPLRKGRAFTYRDNENTTRVAIINETMAERYFPGEDPIGMHVKTQTFIPGKGELGPWVPWRIVGVIQDVKMWRFRRTGPEIYVPYFQSPRRWTQLAVHTEVEPRSLIGSIENVILSVDKGQPVTQISTMEETVAMSTSQPEFRSSLLSLFATLALLLAGIGIYGVIAYSVAARAHEIGIRVALGAKGKDIVSGVMGEALGITSVGVVLGIAAAFGLTRLLSSVLYGVTATDTATFAAGVLLLMVVAVLASYIPARRASKVDPIVVLRQE